MRRIGNAHTSVFDERQLALWTLARIGHVDDLIRNARDAQPGLELTAKRAEVRNSEHARKLEQLDGRVNGVRHVLHPSAARAGTRRGAPSNHVRFEDATHLVPTRPVAVEAPMLELDVCASLPSAMK